MKYLNFLRNNFFNFLKFSFGLLKLINNYIYNYIIKIIIIIIPYPTKRLQWQVPVLPWTLPPLSRKLQLNWFSEKSLFFLYAIFKTYFVFKREYFDQTDELSVWSPLDLHNLSMANIFMGHCKKHCFQKKTASVLCITNDDVFENQY